MNADDFKDFCSGGRYEGCKVMVQLHAAGTFMAMLDARKELQAAQVTRSAREFIMRQAAAAAHELTEDELRQLPGPDVMKTEMVQPVPLLIGMLERRDNLLLLRYVGPDGSKMVLSIVPDDVKHLTVAEATRILT
jgi:hypothetical protein